MVRVFLRLSLAVAPSVFASAALADRATSDSDKSGHANERVDAPAPPDQSIGFSLFGGVVVPGCNGQEGACDGTTGPGPSVRALVLYQPDPRWGFGLMGQVARVHWATSYIGMVDGLSHPVDADLTTGFGGLASRFTIFPAELVSPVLELAFGSSFQSRPAEQFNCPQGFTPAVQIGLGARIAVAPVSSVFMMGSGSYALHASMCGVSDGPPAVPFVDWGIGLHAGASFDVGLGGPAGKQTAGR